jgi:hypothetical protein
MACLNENNLSIINWLPKNNIINQKLRNNFSCSTENLTNNRAIQIYYVNICFKWKCLKWFNGKKLLKIMCLGRFLIWGDQNTFGSYERRVTKRTKDFVDKKTIYNAFKYLSNDDYMIFTLLSNFLKYFSLNLNVEIFHK